MKKSNNSKVAQLRIGLVLLLIALITGLLSGCKKDDPQPYSDNQVGCVKATNKNTGNKDPFGCKTYLEFKNHTGLSQWDTYYTNWEFNTAITCNDCK